jgi:hypothetical protein
MNISDLCTPAFIYFAISFIYLVITSFKNFNIITTIVTLFFILLWSWLLNVLCRNGYSIISWLIIVLPFLLLFR